MVLNRGFKSVRHWKPRNVAACQQVKSIGYWGWIAKDSYTRARAFGQQKDKHGPDYAYNLLKIKYGPIAQLVRAADS